MATLDATQRANPPDRDFADIDSKGGRKLPITDESHVRNALSRFNQAKFESERARERAFRKVLTAASKYGIARVGFVTRRLRGARGPATGAMPSGLVTLMLTDMEGSTRLVHALGDAYPSLLEEVRSVIREAVAAEDGYEVDARADEFFAASDASPRVTCTETVDDDLYGPAGVSLQDQVTFVVDADGIAQDASSCAADDPSGDSAVYLLNLYERVVTT